MSNGHFFTSYIYIYIHAYIYLGCGRCWSFDGNWKLGFTHCMYPVRTTVQGMTRLNFPDVCTEEPMYTQASANVTVFLLGPRASQLSSKNTCIF